MAGVGKVHHVKVSGTPWPKRGGRAETGRAPGAGAVHPFGADSVKLSPEARKLSSANPFPKISEKFPAPLTSKETSKMLFTGFVPEVLNGPDGSTTLDAFRLA